MAKKLRTPIIKPRRQGGTFYTFGSAMEDIGLNVNESHNRVEISHYVLLDLPRFSYTDIDTDLPYINFGNNNYSGDLYTKDSSSQGDFIFADSFQNYCLNMETVLRNQDRYDYASNKTVSERAFWKWLFGHMENSGELVSDGSYFYETKEKSIAKGFGSISAGAQRTDDSGLYNETFVQIPSSYGQMRVLFKKSLDENYLDGKEYLGTNTSNLIENISEGEISEGGMIYFYMLNNDFTYPNPNATVQVRGITSTTTYTLTVVKSDKDNYLIQCLLGSINTNNIPSGNGVLVVNGVAQTYNYFLKSESPFDIIRSTGVSPYAESDAEEDASTAMYGIYDDIDKLEVEFDINKLRNYYSDLSLTYDDIGMGNVDKQSVIDSGYGDYTFNAILVYYSIYDSNKTKRLSTNAYGLYVLDNAISSSDDAFGVDSSSFYFPSIYKRMGTQKKNGTSYSFRINVKPSTAYSGDITVNDNATEAYSMSEDFNDVLRNLTSAVTIMKENAKMLYKISRDNEDVRRFASDTMERVNSMENEVMNIRNGNYPYTASSIFVESGSYTYALPTGLANNIIDSFTITYDSDGSMKLDINDSGLNSSELAIVDRLRKAMNNKNFLDVISIMMLLITALKNIDTTGSGSSDDSSSETAMTPEQIEDYIDGYVDNIVSNIDSLQTNVTALGNAMNDIADDITLGMTSNHKVEVKDREYIVGTQSQMGQMGYVILKRQQNFATQIAAVPDGHTIFEIRYDFNLGGGTVNLPPDCVLKFEGGSISNGTVVGNNSTIKSNLYHIFGTGINFGGTWVVPYIDTNMCVDASTMLESLFNLLNPNIYNKIIVIDGDYSVDITNKTPGGAALVVPSNTDVVIDGTITLVEQPSTATEMMRQGYSVIRLGGNNININGNGNVVGDYTERIVSDNPNPKTTAGHGIRCWYAQNVVISGIQVKNCYGECICISYGCKNVSVNNVEITRWGRNGMAFAGASDIVIDACNCHDGGDWLPLSCIDIEPNVKEYPNGNVSISNCKFANAPVAINSNSPALTESGDVKIENCVCDNITWRVFYFTAGNQEGGQVVGYGHIRSLSIKNVDIVNLPITDTESDDEMDSELGFIGSFTHVHNTVELTNVNFDTWKQNKENVITTSPNPPIGVALKFGQCDAILRDCTMTSMMIYQSAARNVEMYNCDIKSKNFQYGIPASVIIKKSKLNTRFNSMQADVFDIDDNDFVFDGRSVSTSSYYLIRFGNSTNTNNYKSKFTNNRISIGSSADVSVSGTFSAVTVARDNVIVSENTITAGDFTVGCHVDGASVAGCVFDRNHFVGTWTSKRKNVINAITTYQNEANTVGSTRPTFPNNSFYDNTTVGFLFYDTSLTPKKWIVYDGTTWVNLDGTTLS